jgi:hypothetical protein
MMNQHNMATVFRNQILDNVKSQLLALPASKQKEALAPGKWSPIQIIGHLIDSATYNCQRFIQAQWVDDLTFAPYPQEKLVNTHQYQASDWASLVELWYWYNVHICHVVSHTSDNDWNKQRTPHSMDLEQDSATLGDLVLDYIGHLEHHIRQIFPDYVHQTNTHYSPTDKSTNN